MPDKRTLGKVMEKEAVKYLTDRDYKIVEQNFTIKGGEADIIAINEGNLCFVEVKFRASGSFGSAAEAVTPYKQRRLIHTAKFYLIKNRKYLKYNVRFDVLAIDLDRFTLIKGAFDAV